MSQFNSWQDFSVYLKSAYVPEVLLAQDDYSLMVDIIAKEFYKLYVKTEEFTYLVDPDLCPEQFLPYLAQLVGYDYQYDIPAKNQRIIIKNILQIYKRRGTIDSIKSVVKYLGKVDDLLTGNEPLTDIQIFEPYKYIRRYSQSSFSGTDRFADYDFWNYGIYEIISPQSPHLYKDALKDVHPAGTKVWFSSNQEIWIPDGSGYTEVEDPKTDYELIIELILQFSNSGARFSVDGGGAKRTRSGRKSLWGINVDVEYDLGLARFFRKMGESKVLRRKDFIETIPIYPKTTPIIFSSKPKRSTNGVHSGNHSLIQYEEKDTFDPEAETDLQMPADTHTWSLRPATRSHHADRSGMYSFDGAPDGGWVEKPYDVVTDMTAQYNYKGHVAYEPEIQVELDFKKPADTRMFNKSKRSGNMLVDTTDLVTIEIELGKVRCVRDLYFNQDYRWVEFLYAVARKDHQAIKELYDSSYNLNLEAKLDLSKTVEDYILESKLRAQEVIDYGVSIQRGFDLEIIKD
ncbi:tail protein [Bacillus phage vB_BceM-HSE3]|nr:tail protein [Bacillus phage vB_BceM-HSE3]